MRPILSTTLLLAACQPGTPLRFEDATAALGLSFTHGVPSSPLPYGTGAAWVDCDEDGDQDLWVTQRSGPSVLFVHEDGGFTTVDQDDASGEKAGVAVADVDNDGHLDLWVAQAGADAVYRGTGECVFTAVADAGMDALAGATQSGAFGDLDGDGIVDLVTTDHTGEALPAPEDEAGRQTRVYLGQGDGTFAQAEGVLPSGVTQGAGFAVGLLDVDADGDLDIVLVHDAFPGLPGNQAFANTSDGDGLRFEDVGSDWGLDIALSGMGLAVGDVNRDGRVDFGVSNIGRMALMMQQPGGQFADEAAERGVGKDRFEDDAFTTWGIALADFDNDGWEDLFAAGGGLTGFSRYEDQPNGLWHNDDGTLVDAIDGSGPDMADASGRTVAIADANGDGQLDVWVVNYAGEAGLLLGRQRAGHWLGVRLHGTASNAAGIGAKLVLDTDDGIQTRWVHSGSSLGAGHSLVSHFGLGRAETGMLTVHWPSGVEQRLELDADAVVDVIEPPE